MSEGCAPGSLEVAKPLEASAAVDGSLDWYCIRCMRGVAREKDRIQREGKNEFVFRNPEGQRFHILLFSDCPGGREAGLPTSLHTWFPGFAWCYCLCRGCGLQLGWWYEGQGRFVGLIRARIVSAAQWRN